MTEQNLINKGWVKIGEHWMLKGASVRITAHGRPTGDLSFENAVRVQGQLDSWWESTR